MIPASPPFAVFLLLLASKLGANCQWQSRHDCVVAGGLSRWVCHHVEANLTWFAMAMVGARGCWQWREEDVQHDPHAEINANVLISTPQPFAGQSCLAFSVCLSISTPRSKRRRTSSRRSHSPILSLRSCPLGPSDCRHRALCSGLGSCIRISPLPVLEHKLTEGLMIQDVVPYTFYCHFARTAS